MARRSSSRTDKGFYPRVYALVRSVPPGRVTTYGAIAWALGRPGWARQVGWAMAALPDAEHGVPAHRVVNAQGVLSGAWAFGAPDEQRRRLEAEGVGFEPNGRVCLDHYFWMPAGVPDWPDGQVHDPLPG